MEFVGLKVDLELREAQLAHRFHAKNVDVFEVFALWRQMAFDARGLAVDEHMERPADVVLGVAS